SGFLARSGSSAGVFAFSVILCPGRLPFGSFLTTLGGFARLALTEFTSSPGRLLITGCERTLVGVGGLFFKRARFALGRLAVLLGLKRGHVVTCPGVFVLGTRGFRHFTLYSAGTVILRLDLIPLGSGYFRPGNFGFRRGFRGGLRHAVLRPAPEQQKDNQANPPQEEAGESAHGNDERAVAGFASRDRAGILASCLFVIVVEAKIEFVVISHVRSPLILRPVPANRVARG